MDVALIDFLIVCLILILVLLGFLAVLLGLF